MNDQQVKLLVANYFRGENEADLELVSGLFEKEPEIRNAANPPLKGPDAVQKFCEDFWARTASRQFDVLGIAYNENMVFAWWKADVTFKAGVAFGDVKAKRSFPITLSGVCRFDVNPTTSKISRLDVYHETTSAVQIARAQV